VIVGDSGVGKSCILLRFTDNNFNESFISTIGVDFRMRTLTIDNQIVKFQIWDTAGQERFKTITTAYYRGSDGIIFVYDVTSPDSFNNIQQWIEDVTHQVGPNITKLLIGNKADLFELRQVKDVDAQNYADKLGILFIETSAKTSTNIDNAFITIASELLKRKKIKSEPSSSTALLKKNTNNIAYYKKKFCNC
ncbi:MAG: Ras-related protein Rab-1A, partial [Edafosvirus sp.]